MRSILAFVFLCAGCGSDTATAGDDAPTPDAEVQPMPVDVTTPFPIDGATLPNAPDTYKGLALELVNNGAPTVTALRGVIGVVCIGMSNSNQECGDFIAKLGTTFAGQYNAEIRILNCAVGGHAIERWNDPAFDATLWDACIRQIGQRNLAVDQIKVVYHKAANQLTSATDGSAKPAYPDPASDYFAFHANLTTFAGRVAQKLPAVQAVYTSSRSYGGFAMAQATRGEPLSYEEGHALNTWLAENPAVDNVWYGWGPYLWAPDCANGTNGSGTCYVRDDYVADGVHPAAGARDKISQLIHARMSNDTWYQP
ncbi:MAG: hypothetical protein ACKV2T_33690 [Kofleriaceae bacterium]